MNIITNTTEVTLDTKPVRTKNAKPVFCITDHNVYASVTDAAMAEKVHVTCISSACLGKLKTANGKQWCFVKDMPIRILDISNSFKEIYDDAMKYRVIDAERKAKEAHQQAMHKLEEKIVKRKLDILEMQEQLEKEQQMLQAMEQEFSV